MNAVSSQRAVEEYLYHRLCKKVAHGSCAKRADAAGQRGIGAEVAAGQFERAEVQQVVNDHGGAHALGCECGPGRACDAPVEDVDEERVEEDVQHRADERTEKRVIGAAVGAHEEGAGGADHREDKAQRRDPCVRSRVRQYFICAAEQVEQRLRPAEHGDGDQCAAEHHEGEAAGHAAAGLFSFAPAEQQVHDGGGAHAAHQ